MQNFLKTVSGNEEYKKFFRNDQSDFTRSRKLPFEKLVVLIAQLCKKTLSVEIENFFTALGTPNKSYSVPAFCMQRMKLHPWFFYAWNMALWQKYYSEYGKKVKRWRGFRILGCDGSSIALVNRPELQSYFGGQSNQHNSSCLAKTFYCYDVLNKMILFPQITPYRYSEMRMAYDFVDRTPIEEDMLLIFDRNFSNYKMAALLQFKEKEIKYVIRVKDGLNFAKKFMQSKKKSDVIEIFPGPDAIKGLFECGYIVSKETAIKLRLIRVQLPGGKVEVLMTNLWEEDGYASEEFKMLYSMRWGVETNIDFQKNILRLESLSGQTPVSAIQDFFATVFISNLHFLLIKQAQKIIDDKMTNRKYPCQVNNNKAFGKIKENIILLFTRKKPIEILKKLTTYFIRTPLPVRKGRTFPRIRKNPLTKNKHRTFTNYKPAF